MSIIKNLLKKIMKKVLILSVLLVLMQAVIAKTPVFSEQITKANSYYAESKFSEALGFLLQLKSKNIAKTATVLIRVVFVFIYENI